MKTNAKVYVMRGDDGRLKVGHSRDPDRRSKELGGIEILHTTPTLEQAERIERLAHRLLALSGKHVRGEWFEANLEDAIAAIETAVKQAEGNELELGARFANDTKPLHMRANSRTMSMLDDLRKAEDDLPSRSEMIRRLVERAHKALKK